MLPVGAHFFRAPARPCQPEWGRGCVPRESDDTEVVPPSAASGRLVSRAAGQTEADGGEAEVRVSEVAAAGESAVVRMLVQLPPRMRWS